ncbi:NAD(P)H-hydrate dehydratase [Cognatishimia sp. F0-27]|uniref:NAD(P)H-hydrate dehydratase n=1 Tax=Cognatishimia sp. F0-27 TaxID=2816855 RepID=UPI001DDA58BC|nr:NAD(P)H-hydrate dehydratase [Cognatishimia sp. F0-27]
MTRTRPNLPLDRLRKRPEQHKFDHGHAVMLSGGMGRSGAARLAARAALRAGAGLVTIGAPGSAMLEIACQITALMVTRVEDADALRTLLEDARITGLCLGPGLGVARAAALLPAALDGAAGGRVTVIDADALTALAQDPALRDGLSARCLLTPHMGEFARVFPDLARALRDDPEPDARQQVVAAAAQRVGAWVLLKGAVTVIAGPDGAIRTSDATGAQAAPDLATAGSGDVLAGILTGLGARGVFETGEMMEMATWLHAEAGRRVGPGLIAEDLPEALPGILREG